jgi:hypothetical protein
MTEYEMFLRLLKAETEGEVDAVLQESGYFEHNDQNWRPLGDDDNNWSTVGNQNTNPTGALVEKLINCVDAMLIAGCWKAGINPDSEHAPKSMADAACDFFDVPNGRLDSMTAVDRGKLADKIHFVATGPKTAPNYLIIDRGEGQSPWRFPATLLSTRGKNKYGIPFVQGINNCGGTAVLRFCGTQKYQLIVSRRNPDCPVAADDDTRDLWGFTLVRQVLPSQQRRPRPTMWYLVPGGRIPSFRAAEIPVLPAFHDRRKPPKAYEGGLPFGTCIKVYAYNWSKTARSLATTNAREELEKYLYTLALPVRITETRDLSRPREDEDENEGGTHYFQTTLSGLAVNIATHREGKRGSRVEEGFSQLPLQVTLPDIGELTVAVTVYRDKDNQGKAFDKGRIPHGVLFNLNGQVHHREPSTFIKEKLGYGYLDKHMLVAVDCTNMSSDAQHNFLTPARDRTVDWEVKKCVVDELVHHLSREESPLRTALRELNARRRQEQLKDTLNDDEPAKVLEDLVRTSPALAAILSGGARIHNPWLPGVVDAPPFIGKRFPTYFRISHEPEGGLVKPCPINRTCRVQFETDAENGYLNRPEDPGQIAFSPQGINRAWNLRNGMVGATFIVPPNARIGDFIPVEVQVTDNTQGEPFVSRFKIHVLPAARDEPRTPGTPRPRGGQRLAMPEVRAVTRDGREIDGKPTLQWGNGNDFNEFTALEIRPSGDEEGKYDIFVNMDNIHLVSELHRERRNSEHPLIIYYFKYGLTLVALGMLQEHRRRQKAESENGHEGNGRQNGRQEEEPQENGKDHLAEINAACMGIATVIIPVIQRLSQGPARVLADA